MSGNQESGVPSLGEADLDAIADRVARGLTAAPDDAKAALKKETRKRPLQTLGIVALVVLVIVGGIAALIMSATTTVDGKEQPMSGKVESSFFELVAHLPTIALVILIAIAAVFVFNTVRNLEWFDRRGPAREMLAIAERSNTDEERPSDPIAIGIATAGNAVMVGLIAGSLLLHFG